MGETNSSRRAAFEAIVEAGADPLLFENMPVVSLEEIGGAGMVKGLVPPQTQEATPVHGRLDDWMRRVLQRKRMNRLLENSDYFVGIYAETMGVTDPYLNDRTPIEYELLRFLVSWQLMSLVEAGAMSAPERSHELERLFPSPTDAGQIPLPAQELEAVASRVRTELSALGHVQRLLGPTALLGHRAACRLQSVLRELQGTLTYAHVFADRVRLFVKQPVDDRPLSASLINMVLGAPYTVIKSDPVPHAHGTLYVQEAAILHQRVYEWVKERPRKVGSSHEPLVVVALNTEDEPGYLELFCRDIFRAQFNISKIECGVCGGQRALGCQLRSYHGPTSPTELSRRCKQLAEHLRASLNSIGTRKEVVVRCSEEAKIDVRLSDIRPWVTAMPSAESDAIAICFLQVFVADVPGMMYRIVEIVSSKGGNVADIQVPEAPPSTKEFVSPSRKEVAVWASFPSFDGTKLSATDISNQVCPEIRQITGVYDVRLATCRVWKSRN
jgi:hypothetical protein